MKYTNELIEKGLDEFDLSKILNMIEQERNNTGKLDGKCYVKLEGSDYYAMQKSPKHKGIVFTKKTNDLMD